MSNSESEEEDIESVGCDVEKRSKKRRRASHTSIDDDVAPELHRQKVTDPTSIRDEFASQERDSREWEYGWPDKPVDSTETSTVHEVEKKTSLALLRDAMDSLGMSTRAHDAVHDSKPIFLNRTFRVRIDILDEHMKELEHNALFEIAVRKLWTSICPDAIDVMMVGGKFEWRPMRWFSEFEVNTVWAAELRKAMWSIVAVGYFAVTYSPSPEHGGSLMPIVLHPCDYTLSWTVDQHGRRYYTASPRKLPISPQPNCSDTVRSHPRYGFDVVSSAKETGYWHAPGPQFEAADVYVETCPTDTGEIRSRARSCIQEMVALEQCQRDLMLQGNIRSNIPLITTFDSFDFSRRTTLGMGEQTPSAAVYGAMGSSSTRAGPPAGMMPRGSDSMEYAESSLGLQMFEFAARTSAAKSVSGKTAKEVVSEASAAASVTPLRLFDPLTGRIVNSKALQPWERAHLPLPPGCKIGTMQLPDIPKMTVDFMDRLAAVVFATIGCPAELVLGVGGGAAHVATSTLTQEALRATVKSWRNLLERHAEMIYWRIHGYETATYLASLFDQANLKLDRRTAELTMMDLSIRFTFRDRKLDPATAIDLYQKGIITRDAMNRILMDAYGISESAFAPEIIPPIVANNNTAAAIKDIQPSLGDIGIDEPGGIGFVDGAKKPESTTTSIV